jgi:hypothetical protein
MSLRVEKYASHPLIQTVDENKAHISREHYLRGDYIKPCNGSYAQNVNPAQ